MRAVLVSCLLLACTACADSDAPVPPRAASSPGVAGLQVGDSLLGLRVARAEVAPESGDSSGWYGSVDFEGEVELRGSYRPHPEYPELRELCFYPDEESASRLPRFPNDVRTSWLCFSNQAEAQRELGALPEAGTATILIDDFHYLFQPSDVYNAARLVSVLSRS